MTHVFSHEILSRQRAEDFGPTLVSDFTVDAGRPVGAATLIDPSWSLYGLDLSEGKAIFVQMPDDVDLTTAAFVQITQFRSALRLITVALDDLEAVAALMPEPDHRVLMFSMGRCGSTLVSKVMAQVPGVCSLSEPGPFLTLALARHTMAPALQRKLVAALTRLMFRPGPRHDRILALKFHSQVLFLAEHFHDAFPEASFVFQYRDGGSWANSFRGFMQMVQAPLWLEGEDLTRSWTMMTAGEPFAVLHTLFDTTKPVHHDQFLAPGWAMHMREYQRLKSLGVPLFPLNYKDLNRDSAGAVQRLLAHCQLGVPDLAPLMQVFAHDSQEGTQLARGGAITRFGPENHANFRAALARYAPELDPNLVLTA